MASGSSLSKPGTFLLWMLLSLLGACQGEGPAQGEDAPDFQQQALDGQPQSLAQHKGKLVLLHFWADWCESCRKEFPLMQAYYKDLAGPDFELIAVNVKQPRAVPEAFAKEFGVSFPMLADEEGKLAEMYQVSQYPTNYLIGPEGKVARKVTGWIDKEFVTGVLRSIRANKAP